MADPHIKDVIPTRVLYFSVVLIDPSLVKTIITDFFWAD